MLINSLSIVFDKVRKPHYSLQGLTIKLNKTNLARIQSNGNRITVKRRTATPILMWKLEEIIFTSLNLLISDYNSFVG